MRVNATTSLSLILMFCHFRAGPYLATSMKTLHVVISGLVQGVGFRYFTMRNARTLGIRGWVRNLPSGEVEVLAQGNDAVLEDFVRELRNGPGAAHVRSLRREWIEEDEMYDSFDMRGSS